MSISSWKEEFYPVPADEVGEEGALEHSLRKWIGLRRENLRKHDVSLGAVRIAGYDGGLTIDGTSCALCAHYYSRHGRRCEMRCPLVDVNDGYSCDGSLVWEDDDKKHESDEHDHYTHMRKRGDPEPMINLLEKAIRNKEAWEIRKEKA